jgi:hypothetical protein
VITAGTGLGQLISKVKSWQFLRQLAKAEKQHANTQIIANYADQNWNAGMTALLGLWNNNNRTHKDWMK